MNKLIIKRKSNAFVIANHKKKYGVFNHFVKASEKFSFTRQNIFVYNYINALKMKGEANWIFQAGLMVVAI